MLEFVSRIKVALPAIESSAACQESHEKRSSLQWKN